jgi:cytochrome c oxidase assembly factor CtaG
MRKFARTTIAIALLLACMLLGTIIGARAQQAAQNNPTAFTDAECRWIFYPPQSSNVGGAILLNRCTGDKQVHEARQVRDAEKAKPGVVRKC